MSQREAARILDVAQPDLSNLLRGRCRGYSVERLMRMLTAFDRTVSIVVAEKGREAATIPVGTVSETGLPGAGDAGQWDDAVRSVLKERVR